ncbi:proline-rich receptor-like protein kinase PERK2 [Mauremys reevesii]|uniref:proline-rich receptor-like protein kinase PERK2 n=1 Tax=Mauremys reevesii TaxID=260615 RepID=UPI00193ED388|nr:proline-rich receptor-like protein kinase PERK2 [Mauremys reevesii]
MNSCEVSLDTSIALSWQTTPRREPGPSRPARPCSSSPPPCLDLTPPPPSPRQENSFCSWVSGYPTQPVTSVGMPGVGSTGFTGSCSGRGGSTPARPQTCGAGTGSMTPSAWGIEIWPGWERRTSQPT